jgi:hypothetical protein
MPHDLPMSTPFRNWPLPGRTAPGFPMITRSNRANRTTPCTTPRSTLARSTPGRAWSPYGPQSRDSPRSTGVCRACERPGAVLAAGPRPPPSLLPPRVAGRGRRAVAARIVLHESGTAPRAIRAIPLGAVLVHRRETRRTAFGAAPSPGFVPVNDLIGPRPRRTAPGFNGNHPVNRLAVAASHAPMFRAAYLPIAAERVARRH